MEYTKIKLDQTSALPDILAVLRKTKSETIVFVCPRNFPIFSDTKVLKKIKSSADVENKKLAFILYTKFVRNILEIHGFETHATVPFQYDDGPEFPLQNLLEVQDILVDYGKKQKEEKGSANNSSTPSEIPTAISDSGFARQKIEENTRQKSWRSFVFFVFLLLGGLIFFGSVWMKPQATIVIKPRLSAIPLSQNVILEFADGGIPKQEIHLPRVKGIFMQVEIEGSETFPTTNKAYDIVNATGRVTLFNNTTTPKVLVPSRLQTVDGLVFRFNETVTIPRRQGDEPGQIEVSVVADEYTENGEPIGRRGNLDAGTDLFFPALREPLREVYYAKANRGPFTGGETVTRYSLSPTDPERAKELITSSFGFQGTEKLRREVEERSRREGSVFVLLDDTELIQSEVLDFSYDETLIGQEVSVFDVQSKVRVSGIVFDQGSVLDQLSEKMALVQDGRKKIIDIDPQSVTYKVLDAESAQSGGWMKLSVSLQGVESVDFDSEKLEAILWRQNLTEQIAGKTEEETRSLLINYPDIENILDITLSPFWHKTMPKDASQLNLKIEY